MTDITNIGRKETKLLIEESLVEAFKDAAQNHSPIHPVAQQV